MDVRTWEYDVEEIDVLKVAIHKRNIKLESLRKKEEEHKARAVIDKAIIAQRNELIDELQQHVAHYSREARELRMQLFTALVELDHLKNKDNPQELIL